MLARTSPSRVDVDRLFIVIVKACRKKIGKRMASMGCMYPAVLILHDVCRFIGEQESCKLCTAVQACYDRSDRSR